MTRGVRLDGKPEVLAEYWRPHKGFSSMGYSRSFPKPIASPIHSWLVVYLPL